MSDPVIERFLRHIREATAFRTRSDKPDYELRDSLWAQYMRQVATAAPGDRERIERAIRVGTGT